MPISTARIILLTSTDSPFGSVAGIADQTLRFERGFAKRKFRFDLDPATGFKNRRIGRSRGAKVEPAAFGARLVLEKLRAQDRLQPVARDRRDGQRVERADGNSLSPIGGEGAGEESQIVRQFLRCV